MTPRVWMNKLNGQIVIAFPLITVKGVRLDDEAKIVIGFDLHGWLTETEGNFLGAFNFETGPKIVEKDIPIPEQFYDIGEWG